MKNNFEAKLYIHGNTCEGSGTKLTNINPATNTEIGKIEVATANDVEKAILSAKEGFATWRGFTGAQRGKVLYRAAQLLRERVEELARLESIDTGKAIQETMAVDIPSAADAIEYFAGLAPTIHGEHFDLGQSFAYTRREPLGIVAGIGAWNYPLQIAAWKSAPALACGNSMVFKPSELTPLTAIAYAKILSEAGLPPGVFNVVQGARETGSALCTHPKVAKISLTGSVATGKAVMAAAASTLKHVTLELGGKSPLIIFEDSNITNAVSAAILGNFFSQGEVCSNGTRVFVHESIMESFLQKLVERTKKIKIGDPLLPDTQMGPLISAAHRTKVLSYIESGIKEGAKLQCGGKAPVWQEKDASLSNGFFVEPTIFTHCTDDMKIVREEIFGPVMSVLSFREEEEVIKRANNTEFGLAAGVFTQNIQRAHRVIAKLEAGTCWINNYNITPVEVPFGGNKGSGIGRENSLVTINHYTQLKSVYVEMGDVQSTY